MFEKIDNRIIGLQKSMLKDAIGSIWEDSWTNSVRRCYRW